MLLWGPISDAIGVGTSLWIAFGAQLASILVLFLVREVRELPAYPTTAPATRARADARA
jgi:hypothetical protein